MQTLTSGHAAVFLVVAILVVLGYRFALGEPILLWRRIRDFGVPGALLILPAILSYLPYRMNQVEHGLRRGIGSWGNPIESFLASPTHFHMFLVSLFGFRDINETAYGFLFTGYVPTLLALTTAVLSVVRRGHRVDRGQRPPQLVFALQLALSLAALWWGVRLFGAASHPVRIRPEVGQKRLPHRATGRFIGGAQALSAASTGSASSIAPPEALR